MCFSTKKKMTSFLAKTKTMFANSFDCFSASEIGAFEAEHCCACGTTHLWADKFWKVACSVDSEKLAFRGQATTAIGAAYWHPMFFTETRRSRSAVQAHLKCASCGKEVNKVYEGTDDAGGGSRSAFGHYTDTEKRTELSGLGGVAYADIERAFAVGGMRSGHRRNAEDLVRCLCDYAKAKEEAAL